MLIIRSMIIRNKIKTATFEQNIMNVGRCFTTNHVTAGIATRAKIPTNTHVITSSIPNYIGVPYSITLKNFQLSGQ